MLVLSWWLGKLGRVWGFNTVFLLSTIYCKVWYRFFSKMKQSSYYNTANQLWWCLKKYIVSKNPVSLQSFVMENYCEESHPSSDLLKSIIKDEVYFF